MVLFIGILIIFIGIVTIILLMLNGFKRLNEDTISSPEHKFFKILDHIIGNSGIGVFLLAILSVIAILFGIGLIAVYYTHGCFC